MAKHIVQDGQFTCDSGGSVGELVLKFHVPIATGCPIYKTLYRTYESGLNFGLPEDIEPMAINFGLTENGVVNGIKQFKQGADGVEQDYPVPIGAGGDNSFLNQLETLFDDPAGAGGMVLQNMLMEIVSKIGYGSDTYTKSRIYQIKIDSSASINTGKKEEEIVYELATKVTSRPHVSLDIAPNTINLLGEQRLANLGITVNETLTYDDISGRIMGTINIPDIAGKDATISISVADEMEREGHMVTGTGIEVSSSTGVFNVSIPAPVLDDTINLGLSAVLAGEIVVHKEFVVSIPPTASVSVSGLTMTGATINATITDVDNKIGETDLIAIDVIDKVGGVSVDSTTMQKGAMVPFVLNNVLMPNTMYTAKVMYGTTELGQADFTTLIDDVAPEITVTSTEITVPVDTIVDKDYHINQNGLSVIDNVDGDITTTNNVTVTSVDTSTTGIKTQTVTAVDSSGNNQNTQVAITVE